MIIPSHSFGVVASGRPRASVVANVAFTAAEFDFTNISTVNNQTLSTNTVTMSHSGTLAIDCTGLDGGWGGIGYIYKNGVAQTAYTTSALVTSGAFTYSAQYASVAVSNGDQLYFTYYAGSDPLYQEFIVTIRNATFAGTVIDQHYVTKSSSCVLTTAVVQYMGGLDNGPELTAMRMLREHYLPIQGYAEEIQDYYTNSPLIVNAINNSPDKDAIYLEIYAVVKACESFVMNGQWEQAHDQYMTMYLSLKGRFI
jgi:hypothetical protein